MRINLRPIGVLIGLSAVLMAGCADKELAKEVAALRAEVAALKADKDAAASSLAKIEADSQRVRETLPWSKLIEWKDKGHLTCSSLIIAGEGSMQLEATPKGLSLSDSNSVDNLMVTGTGLLFRSENGSQAFFGKFQEAGNFHLSIADDKTSTFINNRLIKQERGDKLINLIGLVDRGGVVQVYDDIGKYPKISLGLMDKNGEPYVAVYGATQQGGLVPDRNYPRETK